MATISQAVLAGNLANSLTGLSAFIALLQQAQASGATLNRLSLGVNGSFAGVDFNPQAPLTAADSSTIFSDLITLATNLQAEWTSQLAAL